MQLLPAHVFYMLDGKNRWNGNSFHSTDSDSVDLIQLFLLTLLVEITSTPRSFTFLISTSPEDTGASSLRARMASSTSASLSLGTGFVSLTLTRGSSPAVTRTEVAMFLCGSMSSCSANSIPLGH